MKAIYCKVGESCKVIEVGSNLKAMQELVKGRIETVTLQHEIVLVANEEGILLGMPFNRNIAGMPIHGPLFFVREDGEHLVSLSEGQIRYVFNNILQEKKEE